VSLLRDSVFVETKDGVPYGLNLEGELTMFAALGFTLDINGIFNGIFNVNDNTHRRNVGNDRKRRDYIDEMTGLHDCTYK
jgi:hypothetical protein